MVHYLFTQFPGMLSFTYHKSSANKMEFFMKHISEEQGICAGADGGPRSRVRARETLHSAPIDTSGSFSAHVSWRGGQHLLTPQHF